MQLSLWNLYTASLKTWDEGIRQQVFPVESQRFITGGA
jgi:hypothetical protein